MSRWRSILLAVVIGLSISAPLIAPFDPMLTAPDSQMQAPNDRHVLGTDFLGRDVFSRALYGGQRTLLAAALAALLAVVPGTLLGMAAAWGDGWLDSGIVGVIQALLAFPQLMLALVILTVMGPGVWSLVVATGLSQVAGYAQVARGAVRLARHSVHVEAAYALGAKKGWIVLNHILPTVQPTLLAYGGVVFSYCIINGAALSFLGLGGEPGIPDWGVMLAEGRAAFRDAPWIGLVPGAAISVTVYTVNSLADRIQRFAFRR